MEGTCEEGCPCVSEGPGGCSFSWIELRATSPGLCLDAITPDRAQEVGKPLPQGSLCPDRSHLGLGSRGHLGVKMSPQGPGPRARD